MQHIDWTDLQTFLAIAQRGRFTRAGAALAVDATTVGRRLRRLEGLIGATLFEQTRTGQQLTEAGEALLARVETMAQAAARISEHGGAGAALSGSLRISVTEGFGSAFLPRHVAAFVRAHPALTLDLVASSGYLSLSKREADIAVMLSRPKAGPVIARKLSDYALRLYAAPGYLARTGLPHEPAALASGHVLIGYVPDLLYAPELRYLDEIHPGLAPTLRSPSIVAQQQLIAAGAGIGVLPAFMGDADRGLVAVLPQRRITRSFWLVTHKDTHKIARIEAGKNWLIASVEAERMRLLPP